MPSVKTPPCSVSHPFVDYARITISSGAGGDGAVHFRREKFVPRGGPDGGDGGRGGDVILRADGRLRTLLDFRYNKRYRAQDGRPGGPNRRSGRSGADRIVRVPCGTVVRDADTGAVLADLVEAGQTWVAARGGRGGVGNARLKSSTRRAPRTARPGEPGTTRRLVLELKLLADVGLVGLPNAGKSTLLSRITSARPKVGDYPFTTLSPNLGVVSEPAGESSLVVADIPGLIRGAHAGAGLGDLFLRHVERCTLLVHLVDVSPAGPADPVEAWETVNRELCLYDPSLARKPQIVAGSKVDAADAQRLERLSSWCRQAGLAFHGLSAVTGLGVEALCAELFRRIHGADHA